MYSLEAAFIEMSREVTRLAKKVQMTVPTNNDRIVIHASLAVTGGCCPYPATVPLSIAHGFLGHQQS